MRSGPVFSFAIAVALLALAAHGQRESVSSSSPDGDLRGSIVVDNEGTTTQGSVSAAAEGTDRAFASTSLVVGPGTAEGSFVAEGSDDRVAETLSVGSDSGEPSPADVASEEVVAEDAVVIEEQAVVTEPEVTEDETSKVDEGRPQMAPEEKDLEDVDEVEEKKESADEKRSKGKKQFITFGGSGASVIISSSGAGVGDAKKKCVVGDESAFKKYLKEGYEVTLVETTRDKHIRVTTALEWPSVSTKHSVVTYFIPEEIKERCDVDYEDLGLEDRTDGESSVSSSGSSFHFSSTSGSSGASTGSSKIRKRVFSRLCSEPFFRDYALFEECQEHAEIDDDGM